MYLLVVATCKAVGGIGFAITLPLVFWAFSRDRSERLYFWLLMMAVMITSNGKIIPFDSTFAIVQRATLMILATLIVLKTAGRGLHPYLRPLTGFLFYIFYMACVSWMGWCPVVSYLKIFLIVFVWMGYLGICNRVMMDERDRIGMVRAAMILFACWVFFGSVALYPFPEISQMNKYDLDASELALASQSLSLFQGMCRHSQLLGPVCAMIGTLVFGDYLYSIRRNSWLYNALLLCCVFCIYKTSSRTAMASFIIGVLTLLYFFMRSRGFQARWKMRVLTFAFIGGLAAIIGLAFVSSVRERALGFVLKYGGNDLAKISQMTAEDILSSRQGKIEGCIANFKANPVFGNGFQVSEDMKGMTLSRGGTATSGMASFLSAPVEKSTWIYAVPEEGGIIGMAIFLIWILYVCFSLIRYHAYIGLSCFIAQLAVNMGEFGIFSLSYVGAVTWACVFAGCVMDSQRYKLERFEAERRMRVVIDDVEAPLMEPPRRPVRRPVRRRDA